MRVDCFVLGGQVYSKDEKMKTYVQLVTFREGRGVFGYDLLGSVVLDGDQSDLWSPMQPAVAVGSFQRFGDQQSFRISSLDIS